MRFSVCVFACLLLSALLPATASAQDSLSLKDAPLIKYREYGRTILAADETADPADLGAPQDQRETRKSSLPPDYARALRAMQEDPAQKAASRKPKPSALEDMYAKRVINRVEQFGYDLFGVPDDDTQSKLDRAGAETPPMPMGAVQDDFVLSSGDELEVMFTGQRSDRALYRVNPSGQLLIPDFPPIPAAGRTIGQVRISVDAASRNLHNTQAYVSLSSVRQIGVLVIGHVKHPGRQTMTVFHTIVDALMASGGVSKTGSLRQIKLVRDGRSNLVDLYALLLHGSANIDLQLRDGDRIIVPSIGPTVAVAGEVKRPGIYEILPALSGMLHEPENTSEKISLNDMLEFGGGVLAPGDNRFLRLSVTPTGEEKAEEAGDPFAPLFGDGAILMVSKGTEKRSGTVELNGHTRRPGMHALDDNPTLGKLLASEDVLGPNIYPLIGLIERWDPDQLSHRFFDFPPLLVLKGKYDRKLEDGDAVFLFSNAQIRHLNETPDAEMQAELISVGSRDEEAEEDWIDDPTQLSYLRERAAFVRGAVRLPGPYPVSEGVTLDSLLAAAGGLALEADSTNIEVTSALQGEGIQEGRPSGTRRVRVNFRTMRPEDVAIAPGDAVRVAQKFLKVEDKSVLVIGEVAHPGRYDLLPGDKVSDLLQRAGGLTQQAYPDGAIFSRESERKAEESRFRAQSREIKQAVAAALEQRDNKIDSGKIAEARALASELEDAQGIGRLTVESDPAVLTAQPELDMLLEPGDRLYIPKRTLTVRVSGEVLSPAALQFREKKKSLDYIHEAGGFTFHADKDRTFVLYPDGSAQPLQVNAWNYNPVFIPPGSTIVVPRDPEPFDFIQSAKDISQILSNLAITAIFIDDVRNGN